MDERLFGNLSKIYGDPRNELRKVQMNLAPMWGGLQIPFIGTSWKMMHLSEKISWCEEKFLSRMPQCFCCLIDNEEHKFSHTHHVLLFGTTWLFRWWWMGASMVLGSFPNVARRSTVMTWETYFWRASFCNVPIFWVCLYSAVCVIKHKLASA